MIRAGTLAAIQIGGRTRVTPEAIYQAEAGPLAVRPKAKRRRETVPREIAELLSD